jgi:type I restriction enzyme S subunit
MSVTAAIEAPTGWTRVRLGSISVRRQETGFADLPLLSVFLGDGVIPRDQREDNHNQVGSDLLKYQRVLPGDIVFNKLRTWQGGFGVSRYDGIISPAYIIVAPDGNEVHSGFLHHLLRSEPYLAELTRLSKWMPPSQFDIAWEDIRSVELVLPTLAEQARIAQFLDDQVIRIDQIVAARQQQIANLAESRTNVAHDLLSPDGYDGPPLSAVALIVDTEHKTAPDVIDGGYWIAGTSALRAGRIVRDALRETDLDGYLGWTERATPRVGDVLLSREAPVGQVGLLESGLPPIAIGQRVVLVRPLSGLDARYLRLVLMSPALGNLVNDAVQGSLHPHLNMADISRLRVPYRSENEQHRLGQQHSEALDRHDSYRDSLETSVALLQEFKSSLISAAVSGEFDVTTASGRGAPA